MKEVYYCVLPGLAILPQNDGSVLFRADSLSLKIEGASATFLTTNVFPFLNGRTDLQTVADNANIEAAELKKHLDQLVASGVLTVRDAPLLPEAAPGTALTHLLERLQLDSKKTDAYLQQTTVAIAGLEGEGAWIALQLLQAGIGRLVLIDPFPLQRAELSLVPFLSEKSLAQPRQHVLKACFHSIFPNVEITPGPAVLTKESLYTAVEGANFLVGCFDKGFVSVHHWLNQAALDKTIPALFTEIENHLCRIGPLVLPGETACFMCYRMRTIACADDFAAAMSYETFLNNQKKPGLAGRGFFPPSLHSMAGIAANEVLKVLLGLEASLAGRVLQLDALSLDLQTHYVLQKPDCPVCLKKKAWERTHPSLDELTRPGAPAGDIHACKEKLVSAHTGILRSVERVPKDPQEPALPYTYGVTLSNHLFFGKEQGPETCSGKGTTLQAAEISALGEGVERYSGATFQRSEIHYSAYADLPGPKLHPEALVLYTAGQYAGIEFSPFDATVSMGWSTARSLVSGSSLQVPSLAVFMNYPTSSPAERLCAVTSNGLAAGATLTNAIVSAALEVIERDAFLISWYNKLPCQRVDAMTHPQPDVVAYCQAYERRGVAMHLYRLHTDFPVHVFMGVGYQPAGEGPCLVVGLGADTDPVRAARGALLEVGQVRPALKQRLRLPETRQRLAELLAAPKTVETLEDHSLLYASTRSVPAFSFLLEQPVAPFSWKTSPQTPGEQLNSLVQFLRKQQSDLIYYNLTPPDMASLGLHTARVIIPGLQPIHFGEKNIRLGGRRLFTLPVALGLRRVASRPEDLHAYPHPLA